MGWSQSDSRPGRSPRSGAHRARTPEELTARRVLDLRKLRVGMVSTYLPTRCGVGRFAKSLVTALERTMTNVDVEVLRIEPDPAAAAAECREVVMQFDPESPIGLQAAIHRLHTYDVVIIQHEFGLYGADMGRAVVELAAAARRPLVVVLHTVLPDPTAEQREIVEALATLGTIVVPSEVARRILASAYGVGGERVHVIAHGSHWAPAPPQPHPRRRMLTWGLLGPGKGIERAIRAMAELRDLEPILEYQVIGQTHPKVLQAQGSRYRRRLEGLVREYSLEDRVRFIDRYLPDAELREIVASADLVLLPYDTKVQVSSGVLADAVAAGRPVVATRFPHAVELLEAGAGIVVAHENHGELARAVRRLLTDDVVYLEAAAAVSRLGATMSWDGVALAYGDLLFGVARPARASL